MEARSEHPVCRKESIFSVRSPPSFPNTPARRMHCSPSHQRPRREAEGLETATLLCPELGQLETQITQTTSA